MEKNKTPPESENQDRSKMSDKDRKGLPPSIEQPETKPEIKKSNVVYGDFGRNSKKPKPVGDAKSTNDVVDRTDPPGNDKSQAV